MVSAPLTNGKAKMTGGELSDAHLQFELHANPPKPLRTPRVGLSHFTPHMLSVEWTLEQGWGTPKIGAHAKIALHPAASVLHYGTSCFEGMKAFRGRDGRIRLFRPMDNMRRLKRSAQRICLPGFDEEALCRMIARLVAIDVEHIPNGYGQSLYIRPAMIGTGESLGIQQPTSALLFVTLAPMLGYFAPSDPADSALPEMNAQMSLPKNPEWPAQPIALAAGLEAVRSWPRGVGDYKVGGNYAPTLSHNTVALKHGYQQNLWLFGQDLQICEAGGMNIWIMLKRGDTYELVTPELDGLILPGITRQSILDLAREHAANSSSSDMDLPSKLIVSERKIGLAEIVDAAQQGNLVEMFGSGTAVLIQPINRIGVDVSCGLSEENFEVDVPCELKKGGRAAREFYHGLYQRQTGDIESSWSYLCN